MAMEQPKTKSCNTTPNESMLRVSFLEQAAALLAITPAELQTSSTQQSQSPQVNKKLKFFLDFINLIETIKNNENL